MTSIGATSGDGARAGMANEGFSSFTGPATLWDRRGVNIGLGVLVAVRRRVGVAGAARALREGLADREAAMECRSRLVRRVSRPCAIWSVLAPRVNASHMAIVSWPSVISSSFTPCWSRMSSVMKSQPWACSAYLSTAMGADGLSYILDDRYVGNRG